MKSVRQEINTPGIIDESLSTEKEESSLVKISFARIFDKYLGNEARI